MNNKAYFLHSAVICKICCCLIVQRSSRLLFPGTHVCVNGNAVVCSIAEFLLTNLCAAEQELEK